ncbi:MAG TPA: tetratricopeptide repeat protein, partial [Candidatus Didemnitutus sp.]|nr:tetratricopeptide repeat protein [Candidatus Didemnitutus sp.]
MKKILSLASVVSLTCLLALLGTGCSPEAKKARHLEQAERAYAAGDYDRAEIEYLNVLNVDAQNPAAIARLGSIYFEEGRIGRALPFLQKARELTPNDPAVRAKTGLLSLATGNFAEARKEATFILEKNPADAEAPIMLAEASFKPEEIQAARQQLEKLPTAESAPVLIGLGTLEMRQQHVDAAEALFKRAVAQDPQFAAAYAALGSLYRLKRDLPQA